MTTPMAQAVYRQIFSSVAAFSVVAVPAPVTHAADADYPASPAHDTFVVMQGKDYARDIAGNVSFTLDLSQESLFRLFQISSADRAIILFTAKPKSPEKTCPYFGLDGRPYEVRQTHPTRRIYRITAPATDAEFDHAREKGCIATDTIPYSKIKPYTPAHNHE